MGLFLYLASHWGCTEPCESFFEPHAGQLREVLHCSAHGALAVGTAAAWKHFREVSQERLAHICPYYGIALRGQLDKSRRAQGLLEHYCALRKGGQLPDCVKQRVAFLYVTQPLELDVSAYAGVHASRVEVCRGQGRFDVHRAQLLLKRKHGCPACAAQVKSVTGLQRHLKHFAPYLRWRETRLVRISFTQEGARWLYRIWDSATGLCCHGITQRIRGRSARKPKTQTMHCALHQRPQAVRGEAVARYKVAASLAQADIEHIEGDNTRWPQGYNRTAVGELFSKNALKLFT